MFIALLLIVLINNVNSQESTCSSFSPETTEAPVNSVVFGHVTAKGSSSGKLAVGGNAKLDQFSIGTRLSSRASWGLVVGGDLDYECGDAHGYAYYMGNVRVGPRVDWNSYRVRETVPNVQFSFSESKLYATRLQESISALQHDGSSGPQGGGIFTFVGTGREVEIFSINCNELSNRGDRLFFTNINRAESTSIIIRVSAESGESCHIGWNSVGGLRFREPSTHILWSFEASSLSIEGSVPGSVLAPSAEVSSIDGRIEGQAYLGSVKGTLHFGPYLFSGCIPTDPCFVSAQSCPTPRIIPPCIAPNLVQDPENPCCQVYECASSCADVDCNYEELECPPSWGWEVVLRAGESGGDPCCDTHACVREQDTNFEEPRVVSCPVDQTIDIPQGRRSIEVSWEVPQFLFVQSVSSNFDPGATFRAGQHVVEYVGVGLRPNTQTFCMFTLTVNQESIGDTCTVGGQVYTSGQLVIDECNQRCVCNAGELINCVRVRQEVQTMNNEDRQLYYHNYKATYNDGDGVLQQYVNNHQQFFSRGLHNNGAFLPWHRGYLLEVENRLRVQDCRVTIPYWNWRLNPRIINANHLGDAIHQASSNGERATRCVNTGTFGFLNGFARTNGLCLQRRISGGSTATITSVESQLMRRYTRASQYDSFRNRLEHGPGMHDSVHCLVGGTMCSSAASNDPLFFNHHANVDKIWDEWQHQGDDFRNAYSGSTPGTGLMPTSSYTPLQMLDLMNSPGGISIMYLEYDDGSRTMEWLNSLISQMSEDELNSIQSVGVGPVGDQWWIDMNMDQPDITVLRNAEDLANSNAVQESVAMTLRNGVERGLQIPNFQAVVFAVSRRLADAGATSQDYSASQLFHALSYTFTGAGLVPRFNELQDIITQDEDGNTLEVITVPVAIVCPTVLNLVCAQGGLTFYSECEAAQAGYGVVSQGACVPDPIPDPISADVDGGASDAYNHGVQELAECPGTAPRYRDPCSVNGVTCFYGLECCSVSKITTTCSDGMWYVQQLSWEDCSQAPGCGAEPEPVEPSWTSVHVRPRGTYAPTQPPPPPPTHAPTRPPTRAPTRSPTTPPPTLPRQPPTPPPTRRPTLAPTYPQVVSSGLGSWQSSVSRPSSSTDRVTHTIVVPPIPPPVPRPIVNSRPPPRRRPTRNVSPNSLPRPTLPTRPTVIPPVVISSIPPTQSSVDITLPEAPPLTIVNNDCPAPNRCGPTPTCCPTGAVTGTLPIYNSRREECGRGCPVCLRERDNRVVNTPFCCRNLIPCPEILCAAPLRATVVRPAGVDGAFPCCPEYRCEDPCSSTVCPTLASTRCNMPFEIPTYRTEAPLMDTLGCCRTIDCVFDGCAPGTMTCPDGTVVERDPTNRCFYPDCPPPSCPNPEQQRFCTSVGGTQVPQVRNPSPDCSWQDCPDYEPCDDIGHLCGDFGTCVHGRSVLTCDCQASYSGDRCDTFTEPLRRTYSPFDRSIGLTDACAAYMCNQNRCSLTTDAGASWEELPAELKSFAGVSSNYLWFVDQDDYLVTYDHSTGAVHGNRGLDDVYDNLVSSNAITPARSTYSYEDVVDGVLPPASESQWVLNWGADLSEGGPCSFMLYLTDGELVFYTSDNLHKTAWGRRTTNEVEVVELCEDRCLLPNGERQTCSNNGSCVRETGECVCDFGYQGFMCQFNRS